MHLPLVLSWIVDMNDKHPVQRGCQRIVHSLYHERVQQAHDLLAHLGMPVFLYHASPEAGREKEGHR